MITFVQATSVAHVHSHPDQAVPYELRSDDIIVWRQYSRHGQVLCHGSQECCSDLVLLPSARNNNILAEIERYVDHKFPRFLDEASDSSGSIPMHTRS
jgi:hypothetical protein